MLRIVFVLVAVVVTVNARSIQSVFHKDEDSSDMVDKKLVTSDEFIHGEDSSGGYSPDDPTPDDSKTHEPSPDSYKPHEPSPDSYKTHEPTPDIYKTHEPTPDSYKPHEPSPDSYKTHEPTLDSYKTHEPSPDSYKPHKPRNYTYFKGMQDLYEEYENSYERGLPRGFRLAWIRCLLFMKHYNDRIMRL